MFEAEKEKKRRAIRRKKLDLIAWLVIAFVLIVGYVFFKAMAR